MAQTILRMLKSYTVSVCLSVQVSTNRILCANVEAKINGKLLLNKLSALNSKLDLSIGFQMVIEERAQQVCYGYK